MDTYTLPLNQGEEETESELTSRRDSPQSRFESVVS